MICDNGQYIQLQMKNDSIESIYEAIWDQKCLFKYGN